MNRVKISSHDCGINDRNLCRRDRQALFRRAWVCAARRRVRRRGVHRVSVQDEERRGEAQRDAERRRGTDEAWAERVLCGAAGVRASAEE